MPSSSAFARFEPAFSPATSSVVRLETEDDALPPARSVSSFISLRESAANAPVMQKFVQQAATVPEAMVRVETSPKFDPVNQILGDELDLCFTGQQDAATTARKISDRVGRALA